LTFLWLDYAKTKMKLIFILLFSLFHSLIFFYLSKSLVQEDFAPVYDMICLLCFYDDVFASLICCCFFMFVFLICILLFLYFGTKSEPAAHIAISSTVLYTIFISGAARVRYCPIMDSCHLINCSTKHINIMTDL